MATGKLTALGVKAITTPGRHVDGDGLMLLVKPDGQKSWVLRLRVPQALIPPRRASKPQEGEQRRERDNRRDFGLGAYPDVSLASARALAATIREQVKAGIDPRGPSVDPVARANAEAAAEKRAAAEAAHAAKIATTRTFEAVARRVEAEMAPTFRHDKHSTTRLTRLEMHAFPALGGVDVGEIAAPAIIEALEPIWTAKPETARRVRQLIINVLEKAHAKGLRPLPSPTSKMIASGLAKQPVRDNHFAAVDYEHAPDVIRAIRDATETMGRLALLFTIYTAARSGETRGATWGEIDLDAAIWRIPASRMKMGRLHNVPLTPDAIAVLNRVSVFAPSAREPGEIIFKGEKSGRALSDATLGKAHKLTAPGTTVHGWRCTFRDWAGETTGFPPDVCEAALSHVIGTSTTRAYQRRDLFDKRRNLMDAWAGYLGGQSADVVQLRPRRQSSAA